MVYFLVDGGMGDSVQRTCQNATNISQEDEIEFGNNQLLEEEEPTGTTAQNISTADDDDTSSNSSCTSSSSSSSSFIADYNVRKHKKNNRSVIVSKQLRLDDVSDEDEIALYPLSNQVIMTFSFETNFTAFLFVYFFKLSYQKKIEINLNKLVIIH